MNLESLIIEFVNEQWSLLPGAPVQWTAIREKFNEVGHEELNNVCLEILDRSVLDGSKGFWQGKPLIQSLQPFQ